MRAQREIWSFLEKWNSKAFQEELSLLLNAGPDFKNLVLPKITMLLFAVESMEDLTNVGFEIPEFN